jgi:three-Cys-motif partner protein
MERIPIRQGQCRLMAELAVVGPWAKEKLDALGRYLDFYTKVLKNQRWHTIYLDAFAGGGRAMVRPMPQASTTGSPLFADDAEDAAAREEQQELIDGSPRVALAVANPFSRYIFVEPDPARARELEALKAEYGTARKIRILPNTATEGIGWMVSQAINKTNYRGVAFLDPFGAKLEWASAQQLADTHLFEVVVNFGLNMAIQRMLPNSGIIPDAWLKTLDAYFGTAAWFDEVYCEPSGLFGSSGLQKRADYSERLLELYRQRLKDAFGHVSTPRLIRSTRGVPLYYLLWAGPHPKGLEGANHILTMGERLAKRAIRQPVQ